MSKTGIISRQYRNASALLQKVNSSVILIKKSYYHLPGHEQITEDDLSKARKLLADVLFQLTTKNVPSSAMHMHEFTVKLNGTTHSTYTHAKFRSSSIVEGEALHHIPTAFLKHLRKQEKGASQSYFEKLQELYSVITENRPLTDELVDYLDQLCLDLDAEASSIYQNLRKT